MSADTPDPVFRAVSLLHHAARPSKPLRDAVDEVVRHVRRLESDLAATREALVRMTTCDGCGAPRHAPNDECWYMDLSECAYHQKAGDRICSFGCESEPECMTCQPSNGWPLDFALAVLDGREETDGR